MTSVKCWAIKNNVMKAPYIKIALSFFLVIINLNSAKAQYQSIFGSSQTSWNIIKGNFWGTGTDSLVTVSDTIINSYTYKKILYYDISSGTTQIESIVGYLREDSIQGKAWFFNTEDIAEQLIMDLNLNLGDTFYVGGVWNSNTGYHLVDSVWTVFGRKHIRIDVAINPNPGGGNNEKLIFIEGVGTNIGIGYQDLNYIDNFPYLLCSYKNENLEYHNSNPVFNGNCNYTTVGVDDYLRDIKYEIYPNPSSTNEIIIEHQNEKHEYLTIELYSSTGRLLLSLNTMSFEKTRINTNDFPAGIYFISIKDELGNITTKKWIKAA